MRVDCAQPRPAQPARSAGKIAPRIRAAIWSALGFGLLVPGAQAADPVVIGVRSSLVAPAGAAVQGRIYTILSIQQISAWEKVVHPVEVDDLLALLRQSLAAQGFQAAKLHQPPEIVLTVEYGRDWLDNPYLGDPGDSFPVRGVSSASPPNGAQTTLDKVPNQPIAGVPVQLMNHLGTGVEARTQKAGYEKLYLRITAWKYPPDPKGRSARVWSTTMVVDDPDHSDLNVLAASMLAAGAPHFGRTIAEPELEVSQSLPNGHVKLGVSQVVDAPAPKPADKSPRPVSASLGATEPAKAFNLAPGEAITTLREFARQADTEIIYSSAQVSGIKTPAVSGEFLPRAALDRLLEGSGLIVILDEKSGAFVIRQPSGR